MNETTYFQSPIGWIKITIQDNALSKLELVDTAIANANSPSLFAEKVETQLREYFEGKRKDFDILCQAKGTEFQSKVWHELTRIPYGETISYQELAQRVGNKNAQRAVGSANGKNPICLIIPCHRVIQANGKIGGYAYGTPVKEFLLNLERKHKIQGYQNEF